MNIRGECYNNNLLFYTILKNIIKCKLTENKLIELEPNDELYLNKGHCLEKLGRYKEANEYYYASGIQSLDVTPEDEPIGESS